LRRKAVEIELTKVVSGAADEGQAGSALGAREVR